MYVAKLKMVVQTPSLIKIDRNVSISVYSAKRRRGPSRTRD